MGEGSGEDFASILGLFQDLQIAPAIAGVSPVTMYSLSTMKQVTSHSKSIGAIAFPLGSLKKRRTSYCSLVNCSFWARKQHRQLAEKRSRETSGCRGARSELGSLHPQTEGTKKVTLFIVRVIMRKKKPTHVSSTTAAPVAFASDRLMRNSAESSTYVRVTQMMFNKAIGIDETG